MPNVTGSAVTGSGDQATYQSQSPPPYGIQLLPNEEFHPQFTFLNQGSTTWSPGSYVLHNLQGPGDIYQGGNVGLGSSVSPGSSYTWTLSLDAPSSSGVMEWQPSGPNGTFGAAVSHALAVETDGASLVSQSASSMNVTPGQTVQLQYTLTNTGGTTWVGKNAGTAFGTYGASGQQYYFASYQRYGLVNTGGRMVSLSGNFVRLSQGYNVVPNSQFTWTVTVQAPSTPGTYTTRWQMQDKQTGDPSDPTTTFGPGLETTFNVESSPTTSSPPTAGSSTTTGGATGGANAPPTGSSSSGSGGASTTPGGSSGGGMPPVVTTLPTTTPPATIPSNQATTPPASTGASRVSFAAHNAGVARGISGVALSCAEASCSGTLRLIAREVVHERHGSHVVTRTVDVGLGVASYSLTAGEHTNVYVRLDRAGLDALAGATDHEMVVDAEVTGATGTVASRVLLKEAVTALVRNHSMHVHGSTVKLALSCTQHSCSGIVRLSARVLLHVKQGTTVRTEVKYGLLGQAHYRITSSRGGIVTLRLDRSALVALRRHHDLVAEASVLSSTGVVTSRLVLIG